MAKRDSGGSTLEQGVQLHPEFGTMQQNVHVTVNYITLLCRPKRFRIRNLPAL